MNQRTVTLPSIAIIGGGLAGTLAAIKIIRTSGDPIEIRIYEPREELGRGLAYEAPDPFHSLNGPAKAFSLRGEDLLHFAAWLQTVSDEVLYEQAAADVPPEHWFAPRKVYVRDRIEDLEVDAETGGITLITASKATVHADHVILALGIFGDRAASSQKRSDKREDKREDKQDDWYLADPWNGAKLRALAGNEDLLLVGSSLTMIDTVVALEKAGYRGRYQIVSRRGLTPESWRDAPAEPEFLDLSAEHFTTRALLRAVRSKIATLRKNGEDWQRTILAVRPHLSTIWSRVSITERKRFMRHVRPYWDLFLHRAPPAGSALVNAVRAAGRLVTHAANLEGFSPQPHGRVQVRYRPRGQDTIKATEVDAVINCVGFEHRWERIDDPLVKNLLARGIVRPSAIGLGVDADPQTFATIDAAGRTSSSVSVIGLPLRGVLFESGTIGELLKQSLILAPRLTAAVRNTEFVEAG
jgi:uncharacterized NAD(P)/FAD-binding protein YdhS